MLQAINLLSGSAIKFLCTTAVFFIISAIPCFRGVKAASNV
ncbi:hypothetical protein X560_0501 [Listeria fleischmannii 1991]|uniref:Uncharacterized protein n=1 Tax=Listeria fleischmannii 1991 TaxID=1430899 RepID=A0A0J8GDS0_9LIST|nr:hypothetical protein X560_0501 [Listeria fleischmannii 1991]